MAQQIIVLALTTAEPMLAAMLRLVAVHGVPVAISIDPAGIAALDVSAAIDGITSDIDRRNAAAHRAAVDADVGDVDAPGGRLAEGVSAGASQSGITIDVEPADPDDAYRGPRQMIDRDVHDGQLEALRVVGLLAQNPKLAKVVRHLVRPLVVARLAIDGDPEVVLTRIAEDFATCTAAQLSTAAALFTVSKRTGMPSRAEIAAALGIKAAA